jgi:hypothetical protein
MSRPFSLRRSSSVFIRAMLCALLLPVCVAVSAQTNRPAATQEGRNYQHFVGQIFRSRLGHLRQPVATATIGRVFLCPFGDGSLREPRASADLFMHYARSPKGHKDHGS